MIINGKLVFHSETGTEGGYWALQDYNEIKKISPEFGVFGGREVWDQTQPDRRGRTQDGCEVLKDGKWLPLPDPIQEESDYYKSSLFKGSLGDQKADRRLMEKYGFRVIYADEQWDRKWGKGNWHYEDEHTAIGPDGERYLSGGTPLTEPIRPYGVGPGELTRMTVQWDDGAEEQRLSDSLLVERWSYEGLKILGDGDLLTIYSKEEPREVLWEGEIKLKEHGLFTETAFGLWIHADQEGVDRKLWARWFLEEYPALLLRPDGEITPHGESSGTPKPSGNPGTPNS